ncbi:MAG: anaerobic carbon-monoxide dehydrogenase catalytic subunit [Phycisphaerales bacterium]|nr:MAG: anaerobic carbon-monoxide dehydrogenase catalytic subunit [Phycisphaerales bacterium]
MDPKERSTDKAAQEMIARMAKAGQENAWDRLAAQMPQCGFGKQGVCCRICAMGPCRITKKASLGVCGADVDTIVSRNFLRAIAAGVSAHSDHGRTVAEVFLATAKGEAGDYQIKDVTKLHKLAQEFGVKVDGRSPNEIAVDIGEIALAEFGKAEGTQLMARRAPEPRKAIWDKLGITPRAVDREVTESLHRSTMGVDQDYKNILLHASRVALADGWGGAMLATELQDVLFGTPYPGRGEVNMGVLQKDQVNIIVHGHEPILSEMIAAASQDKELLAEAKKVGAKGINVAGTCCTANELLMRHGIPIAGNFLNQELVVATGAIELMAVDVQCVMQGLTNVAKCYHTKLVTTADKAKIPGVEHVSMDERNALNTAKDLVKMAIDNFKNRGEVYIPKQKSAAVGGFSFESINYMLGGRYRASFRPLNDNIINGRIRGVVGIVGCTNPKIPQDLTHTTLTKELIKRDVLVLTTGCATIACGKQGLANPRDALDLAGPGLREVCEAVGIPPVLACGSCVDNTRLLVSCTELVREGGLGDDISELPVAGACLESVSEKAYAIGQYFVASGALVVFAKEIMPISGSQNVSDYLFGGIEKDLGGKWAVESDPVKAAELILAHIESKRDTLGINKEKERKLYDMADRRALSVE